MAVFVSWCVHVIGVEQNRNCSGSLNFFPSMCDCIQHKYEDRIKFSNRIFKLRLLQTERILSVNTEKYHSPLCNRTRLEQWPSIFQGSGIPRQNHQGCRQRWRSRCSCPRTGHALPVSLRIYTFRICWYYMSHVGRTFSTAHSQEIIQYLFSFRSTMLIASNDRNNVLRNNLPTFVYKSISEKGLKPLAKRTYK